VGPPCQPPLSYPFSPFSRTPPVLTRPAAPAHAPDGTAGRPAGPDAEPQRARAPEESSEEGKDPLALHATPAGAPPAKGARPHRLLSPRAQSPCVELFCPCTALTGRHIPRGRASAGHPPTRIGVLPLFSVRHRKGRGEGEVREKEGGAGERSRVVTPLRRQCRRPHPSPRGKERRLSALGKEPGRSRNIYAAVNVYVAVNTFATPPSTPSRPRLHRRPNVSTPQPSSSSLPP
jgi:hypothetical protein